MIRWIDRLAGMLATSLVAALCITGFAYAGAIQEAEAKAQEASASQQDAEVRADGAEQSVEEAVQETADDVTAERRKKLIGDAMDALDRTHQALQALEEGDSDAALESLAVATGKLDLVVARNPRLALAPVDVRLVTHDVHATIEDIERARKEASDLLDDGRLQDARRIVEGLRSDVVVEVVNLPLATYPAAIVAITPMIDAGEIEEAKVALQQALNTLVITQHVHPLPILRAEHLLARADELVTTADRSSEQNDELASLLDAARHQLEFAQALGYGEEDDFEGFYEQLDEIGRKTSDGKSGKGFFDRIQSALRSFGSSSDVN